MADVTWRDVSCPWCKAEVNERCTQPTGRRVYPAHKRRVRRAEYEAGMRTPGTVYLLHFDQPYEHAQHYLGWTQDPTADRRLNVHCHGMGSPLVSAAVVAGIGVQIVRTWPGDRHLERALKNRKNSRGLCPCCKKQHNEKARLSMQRSRARKAQEKRTA